MKVLFPVPITFDVVLILVATDGTPVAPIGPVAPVNPVAP
jgi:hypothetical protein